MEGGNNSFFGTNAGRDNTFGGQNSFLGKNAGLSNTTGNYNTVLGADADVAAGSLSFAAAIGSNALVSTSDTIVLGKTAGTYANLSRPADRVLIPGLTQIQTLGAAGATTLCRNESNEISTCSSSIRYKSNINEFNSGLNLVRRLRPVSFNWRTGGMPDMGLVAEEVADVEPLLVTYNDKGEVEGVKYDRVGVVLLNAVKEQQTQIETQQNQIQKQNENIERLEKQNQQQQFVIDGLRKLVCQTNPQADVCKEIQK